MRSPNPSRREFLAGTLAGSGILLVGGSSCRPVPSNGRFSGDLTELTIQEASRLVREREISPVELTKACLARIEKLDPAINAFITVTGEAALEHAKAAEREIAAGRHRGPLHGIPIAIKDNIDTKGVKTTAGSAAFKDRIPAKDAEVVRRLKEAGAVVLGKLNLHEFANGSTSAISHFGPVHNPWDLERITGGSSGGSAAAVAAGLCFAALGSDTGGSIRIPAAYCGVVGLNPTYGMVSNEGSIPLSVSYDRIGPLTRTVADAALVFRVLTDDPAARTFDPDVPASVSELRVGVLPTTAEYCDTPPGEEVEEAFEKALTVIRSLVAKVGDTKLPVPDLGSLIDYESFEYHRSRLEQSPGSLDPRTRETLLGGKEISAESAKKMKIELDRHRDSIGSAFKDHDLIITPTNEDTAMLLKDAEDPFAGSACTFAFSIAGIPVISIPCGFSESGLPIGLQIAGPPRSEPQILALAYAYERATEWHKRHPRL